jgi:Ca-activated chloride channel family protein
MNEPRPSSFGHRPSEDIRLLFGVRRSAFGVCLLLSVAAFLVLAASPCAQDTVPMFRASVDVVTVDAFAHHDRKPIGNLTAGDFVVRDNGVEQVVDSLGTTDSAHVIIGLDLSGSVDGRTLEQLRSALRELVAALTPQDRLSLFTFSDRVRLLLRAVPPGGDLDATLARFEASGATPLHDAIVFGSALSFADRRPSVFLLFTDGQDTTSWTSAARTLDVLRRTNVVVFPVGAGLPAAVTSAPFSEIFTRQTWIAPTPGDGLRLLQSAADVTGGEFLRIDKGARLPETFRGILSQYRQRYLLTYSPSGATSHGWHRLDVRLRNRAGTVVAREGYMASKP